MKRLRRQRLWLSLRSGLGYLLVYSAILLIENGLGWAVNIWWETLTRVAAAQLLFWTGRFAVHRVRDRRNPPLQAIPRVPGWSVVFFSCGHWDTFGSQAMEQAQRLLAANRLASVTLHCWRCRDDVRVRSVHDGPKVG